MFVSKRVNKWRVGEYMCKKVFYSLFVSPLFFKGDALMFFTSKLYELSGCPCGICWAIIPACLDKRDYEHYARIMMKKGRHKAVKHTTKNLVVWRTPPTFTCLLRDNFFITFKSKLVLPSPKHETHPKTHETHPKTHKIKQRCKIKLK